MPGMKVGTKSILFGAHMWCIHPWFVALAWWKLYGFPKDYRLWVAFFVHDLGYWGKPNMDGPEGEEHVWLGANIMSQFDGPIHYITRFVPYEEAENLILNGWELYTEMEDRNPHIGKVWLKKLDETRTKTYWRDFCLYHSRFYAKKHSKPFSQLCVADKLAITLEPWWMYLPRVILSGEIKEYMALAKSRSNDAQTQGKYASMNVWSLNKRQWFKRVCNYLRKWVNEHKDMKEDTWTPSQNEKRLL